MLKSTEYHRLSSGLNNANPSVFTALKCQNGVKFDQKQFARVKSVYSCRYASVCICLYVLFAERIEGVSMTPSGRARTWTAVSSTCERVFYPLKGHGRGYGAWHTNQFTQISRRREGVLISHCFWPEQHTPSPVKGPPAVYNFQELDKPLDQREISLLTKPSGYKLHFAVRGTIQI